MSVDYLGTLAASNGLVREVRVIPPDGDIDLLWTVAADLVRPKARLLEAQRGAGMDMSWVGAAGLRRGPTYVRAAGEAVERASLMPSVALPSGDGLRVARSGSLWRDPWPTGPTYRAVRFARGHTEAVAVPAAAVDFPPTSTGAQLDAFDPGPSGTAAWTDRAAAVGSAARELIERDAVMRAWYCPALARRIADPRPLGEEFGRLAEKARQVGVALHLVDAPGRRRGVLMCLAVDEARGVVGAGISLERTPAQTALKAVQEALQIRSLLIRLKATERPLPPELPITSERDRARFWCAPGAVDLAGRWLDMVPASDHEIVHTAQAAAWPDAVGEHVVVDLTARLPDPIRAMGWCAVKMFAPELQPLRMSEAHAWNVLEPQAFDAPHPFV